MSKYLFVVHSSITLRMARAIIRENQWEREDYIFLSDRGFTLKDEPVKVIDIAPFFIEPIRWRQKAQFRTICRTNREKLDGLYQMIELEVGQAYYLFIPHTRPYAYLALIRHPLCVAYAFVEEGMLSYRKNFYNYIHQASALKRILLQGVIRYCLGPGFRAFPVSLDHEHPKYDGCYGISERTFPTLPPTKKRVLAPPFERREDYAEIDHMLITGPWVEKGYCSAAEYQQVKRSVFQYWERSGVETVHVKFHPRQYFENISIPLFWEVAAAFSEKIKIIEMPREASPEEIAYSSRADFYLAYSSTAIYARLFGCRVFSYAQPMQKNWPKFREFYDHLPPVITDNMTLLEL